MKNNKKFTGVSLLSFVAAIAGVVISTLLLKEDVLSTAKTLYEYFPNTYGVIPSSTWQGAVILGLFISVLEIISASVAFSDKFNINTRFLAGATLLVSGFFDNWTDVVFRSGYLAGNLKVATISTFAFYTFGSEITQSLSWIIIFTVWRSAISDLLWGYARFIVGMSSIGSEWKRFRNAAYNKEKPEDNVHQPWIPTYPPVRFDGKVNKNGNQPKTGFRPLDATKLYREVINEKKNSDH